MATAVSISIRREAAINKLTTAACGIGDSFSELFSDLPPLNLADLGKNPEIKQVVILERVADFLGLVEQGLIAALNEAEEHAQIAAETETPLANVKLPAPAKPASPKPKAKPKTKAARRR